MVYLIISSVQFSRSVVSDSLRPHESQHTRPPCPSPTPGVHSDSRPSSQWCHPAISSSVVPFSSCPQSFPASGSFPVSQLFAWDGQSTDWSLSFKIIPSKEIPGLISFRMDWLDLLVLVYGSGNNPFPGSATHSQALDTSQPLSFFYNNSCYAKFRIYCTETWK